MNFVEIKKTGNKLYNPVFALESVVSKKWLKQFELVFRVVFAISLVSSLLLLSSIYFFNSSSFVSFAPQVFGVTSILFVFWLLFIELRSFYYSYYYISSKDTKGVYIDFDLAYAISKVKQEDVVSGFFESKLGKTVLMRCGISSSTFEQFLVHRTKILDSASFDCPVTNNEVTLKDFVLTLLDKDLSLTDFLFTYGIQKKEIAGITEWIMEISDSSKGSGRWWSRENLIRVPSIGQNWSYGQIYNLEKYQRSLSSGLSRHYRVHPSYGANELKELEAVLSRTREANVTLVGNDEAGSIDIVAHLSSMILDGTVTVELKHKRVILLDNGEFISHNGSKEAFESEFIKIMKEAISAGNIVLVIPDFSALIKSSANIGVDLPSLFGPYLTSQNLQVIALSSTELFHQILEKNPIISQHFENILIKDIDDSSTIKVLENELVRFERRGLFFTYPAIVAIASGAERYFPDGIMPDKAIDLLLEIVPKLISGRKMLVEKSDVLSLIETKTGIPMGEVGTVEKEKLLNLETILHRRIIGQDEAIVAISNAVRRARSGITNPDRPIGSFLFLGPTGVGKTETTKALADAFFGNQANILRLDMSEYSSFDATDKLIGSFNTKQDGVLSSLLREHPYGVLLLDEFEKTTKEVMNLFLQILDEGMFSDMNGAKISARNLMIIATSNAGSELIWESMQQGKDLSKEKDLIVDSLVKEGIFKPELLNRFDGVILFHPLTTEHLKSIADIMLRGLHDRLAEKGINLVIDENLLNFVVSFGTDPKFGARPMNRAIQEKVEELIAKKIISGSIPKGSHVLLTKEELV